MSPLPQKWTAPQILAGRLYFEWEEYEALCHVFGIDQNHEDLKEEEEDEEKTDIDPEAKVTKNKKFLFDTARGGLFSPRPLTFLQEWLAWPPAMPRMSDWRAFKVGSRGARNGDHDGDEGEVEIFGVDDMGANVDHEEDAAAQEEAVYTV
ncbi:hypothetical protein N0V85_009088 [Neurospora sp. IMI 360204]|nr:hypothetical protein N0V85_009088 [Neurospora sp. IMI 360204]